MKNALQADLQTLGFQMEERVRKVGHALIDLQRVSNLSTSMGLTKGNINLQLHDQHVWKSVFETNANLGWSQNTSDTCSGWGPHPDARLDWLGGQGSSEGGNLTVWEGLPNADCKFLRGFDDMLE